MSHTTLHSLAGLNRGERARLGGFLGVSLLLHVVGFGLLLLTSVSHPELIGLGGLAYAFGLRHAFDADHIAAIDNTTRKLLQQGRRPMGVGFFFSLGHSTVVFLIALSLGLAVKWVVSGVVGEGGQLKAIGGIVGTSVSGLFLLLIGLMNLLVLIEIIHVYRKMKSGKVDRASLNLELSAGGLFSRMFSRLFKLVSQSWHLYPIGFLFGLGFDTASEVALLAISSGLAAQGLALLSILSLPIIFAAGMSTMDTLDGAFMAKAYGWAFSNPVRKIFYNLTVTALSVFVAIFIGVVELSQIGIQLTGLQGGVFTFISDIPFNTLGFVIVGVFIVTWAAAIFIYRTWKVEERWEEILDRADGEASAT